MKGGASRTWSPRVPSTGALRRISEDVLLESSLADFFGDAGFFRERLARGFVLHEFHALQQAEPTNLPNMRMILESGEGLAKRFPCGSDALEKLVSFQVIKDGVAGSGSHRMRLIGEAVHESGGALFEGFSDMRSDQNRPQRRVAAGDSFAGENNVGLQTPVEAGKRLARAAHAGHYFIGDEKDAVLAADFGNTRGVAIDCGNSTKRCAHNRLENECSYG